jgi:ADP-ribose pyrophosphatase
MTSTEYTPTDITPPELLPAALAHHVPDWAEGAATPADVPDWAERQAAALVPFTLDELTSWVQRAAQAGKETDR